MRPKFCLNCHSVDSRTQGVNENIESFKMTQWLQFSSRKAAVIKSSIQAAQDSLICNRTPVLQDSVLGSNREHVCKYHCMPEQWENYWWAHRRHGYIHRVACRRGEFHADDDIIVWVGHKHCASHGDPWLFPFFIPCPLVSSVPSLPPCNTQNIVICFALPAKIGKVRIMNE